MPTLNELIANIESAVEIYHTAKSAEQLAMPDNAILTINIDKEQKGTADSIEKLKGRIKKDTDKITELAESFRSHQKVNTTIVFSYGGQKVLSINHQERMGYFVPESKSFVLRNH
jgi:hypothetical protein